MSYKFHDLRGNIDVIAQLHRGNEKALQEIFRQNHTGLYYFAMQILRDKLIVQDVVAEAFIKLWEKRHDFDNLPTVKSFLYITVRNSCINELRQSSRSHIIHEEVKYLTDSIEHLFDEQKIIKAELLQKIWHDIERFPPMRRKIFKMIYLEGLNTFEVANALNISVDTVRVQKSRALHTLRWIFKQK